MSIPKLKIYISFKAKANAFNKEKQIILIRANKLIFFTLTALDRIVNSKFKIFSIIYRLCAHVEGSEPCLKLLKFVKNVAYQPDSLLKRPEGREHGAVCAAERVATDRDLRSPHRNAPQVERDLRAQLFARRGQPGSERARRR